MAYFMETAKKLKLSFNQWPGQNQDRNQNLNQSQNQKQRSPRVQNKQNANLDQSARDRGVLLRGDGELQFYFITAVLFQFFFLVTVIGFHRIIIIPDNFFRDVTRDYLIWYMEKRPAYSYEQTALELTWIIKLICTPIFLLGTLRMLMQKEYARCIGIRRTLLTLAAGLSVYVLFLYYNKYQAEHYRLYMTLLSTELISLILLSYFLKLRKTFASDFLSSIPQ